MENRGGQGAAILTQIEELRSYVDSYDDLSEIIVNSDGSVWIERAGELLKTEVSFTQARVGSIIRLVAGYHRFIVNQDNPVLSAKFPAFHGGRFHALVPPLVAAPVISIRMPPRRVLSLEDLYDNDTVGQKDYRTLLDALKRKQNIVIAGATSSGKTTIANALIKTILQNHPDERFIISEDNPELITNSSTCVHILINSHFSHRDSVVNALRLRPDRIIIGEIRDGAAALELCKAWLTGHPGGITTIHASNASAVHDRFYSLFQEVVISPDRKLIDAAINLIVFCEKVVISSGKVVRRITEIKKGVL